MFVCDVVSAVRSSAILDCTIQISLIFRLCSLRTTIIICSHTKFIYLHKFHSFFQKTKQNKNETQTNWKMNEMPLLWNRFMFIVHLWSLWIVVLFMLVATHEMCKNWRRNNEIKQKMQANSSILIIAREKSAYNLFTLRLFLFKKRSKTFGSSCLLRYLVNKLNRLFRIVFVCLFCFYFFWLTDWRNAKSSMQMIRSGKKFDMELTKSTLKHDWIIFQIRTY